MITIFRLHDKKVDQLQHATTEDKTDLENDTYQEEPHLSIPVKGNQEKIVSTIPIKSYKPSYLCVVLGCGHL